MVAATTISVTRRMVEGQPLMAALTVRPSSSVLRAISTIKLFGDEKAPILSESGQKKTRQQTNLCPEKLGSMFLADG